MSRALELRPLAVAAALGALALAVIDRQHGIQHRLMIGAAVGVAVQLGVRLTRVS